MPRVLTEDVAVAPSTERRMSVARSEPPRPPPPSLLPEADEASSIPMSRRRGHVVAIAGAGLLVVAIGVFAKARMTSDDAAPAVTPAALASPPVNPSFDAVVAPPPPEVSAEPVVATVAKPAVVPATSHAHVKPTPAASNAKKPPLPKKK